MRTPWHVWVIGVIALVWNAGGAFDYWMTQTGNEEYLAMLTEAQRAMMDSRPTWFDATWAFGVWGAVVGSLLILLRSRYATLAFGIALLGLIASSIWSFGIAEPSSLELMGTVSMIFSLAIAISLVALFLYCRAMTARGVFR